MAIVKCNQCQNEFDLNDVPGTLNEIYVPLCATHQSQEELKPIVGYWAKLRTPNLKWIGGIKFKSMWSDKARDIRNELDLEYRLFGLQERLEAANRCAERHNYLIQGIDYLGMMQGI